MRQFEITLEMQKQLAESAHAAWDAGRFSLILRISEQGAPLTLIGTWDPMPDLPGPVSVQFPNGERFVLPGRMKYMGCRTVRKSLWARLLEWLGLRQREWEVVYNYETVPQPSIKITEVTEHY